MKSLHLLDELKRLKALADIGLLYNQNEYDRERYAEIQTISFSLLQKLTDQSLADLKISFPVAADYPTAKVDIRALVLSADKKILLVKEGADGRWSLPGGWADVGLSPQEMAVKECREETGLEVRVKALLAVFDKRLHPHPPQPFYVYKMVFLCEALTTNPVKGFDVMDVQYFGIDALPQLSEDRILESQIRLVYHKAVANDLQTYFD
jgi:ADP-ribose pyrophosphatase YjhB (NUDIX family)